MGRGQGAENKEYKMKHLFLFWEAPGPKARTGTGLLLGIPSQWAGVKEVYHYGKEIHP